MKCPRPERAASEVKRDGASVHAARVACAHARRKGLDVVLVELPHNPYAGGEELARLYRTGVIEVAE